MPTLKIYDMSGIRVGTVGFGDSPILIDAPEGILKEILTTAITTEFLGCDGVYNRFVTLATATSKELDGWLAPYGFYLQGGWMDAK